MDIDLKKLFWVGVAVVVIGLFVINVITPTYTEVKGLKTQIEGVDYTDN